MSHYEAVKTRVLHSLCSAKKAFPHASVVEVAGTKVIIDEVYINGLDVFYAALGHVELKSSGYSVAGILHYMTLLN